MLAVINARIVLERSVIENGVLLIDAGRIADFGEDGDVSVPEGCEILDAGGAYVGPGFVDIHVHGGGGVYFHEDPLRAAAHCLRCGETTVLPTLYTDLDRDGYIRAIREIRRVSEEPGGATIRGIYMEGPYMNPLYGSMPEKNKWRGRIDPAVYDGIVEEAGTFARIWAVAPEREGIVPFVRKVKAVNPSAVISVAHSEATPEEVYALKKYGLILQTHCMNATGRKKTLPGTRSCGPDEACLGDRDMYAELICDSLGIHVHPDMLRFLLAVKGVDRIVLITDVMASREPNPPSLAHVTDLSYDADGNLCGSRLTLGMACRNMRKHTGCSVCDAFVMASGNPARVAGLYHELGSITVGKRADLVFVDGEFNVRQVILGGKAVNI